MDIISQRKVNLVQEEYRLLCLEIHNMDYPAVTDRISHVISGINLLRNDYVGVHGESNISSYREEYEQFMQTIVQNGELADYQMIVRYSRKIQDDLLLIKDQVKQKPHNIPMVDKLSVGIILLLGDIDIRWYR